MIKVTETSTFLVKSQEQADHIAKLYNDLHALIICETSDHESSIVDEAKKELCKAEGPTKGLWFCILDLNHKTDHEDIQGATWPR